MFAHLKSARSAAIGAVAFAALTTATAGFAHADKFTREVTFINNYASPLMYIYATNVSNDSWGEDRLGQFVVDPGWQITIDLNDQSGYCTFDIRAEFADGSVQEDFAVNLCENTEVTYYQM